eukprot:Hpha_TRINITY_DN6086_c1_g1::TRINITY_DN6086_c1_g1_i1::g.63379::m.63379
MVVKQLQMIKRLWLLIPCATAAVFLQTSDARERCRALVTLNASSCVPDDAPGIDTVCGGGVSPCMFVLADSSQAGDRSGCPEGTEVLRFDASEVGDIAAVLGSLSQPVCLPLTKLRTAGGFRGVWLPDGDSENHWSAEGLEMETEGAGLQALDLRNHPPYLSSYRFVTVAAGDPCTLVCRLREVKETKETRQRRRGTVLAQPQDKYDASNARQGKGSQSILVAGEELESDDPRHEILTDADPTPAGFPLRRGMAVHESLKLALQHGWEWTDPPSPLWFNLNFMVALEKPDGVAVDLTQHIVDYTAHTKPTMQSLSGSCVNEAECEERYMKYRHIRLRWLGWTGCQTRIKGVYLYKGNEPEPHCCEKDVGGGNWESKDGNPCFSNTDVITEWQKGDPPYSNTVHDKYWSGTRWNKNAIKTLGNWNRNCWTADHWKPLSSPRAIDNGNSSWNGFCTNLKMEINDGHNFLTHSERAQNKRMLYFATVPYEKDKDEPLFFRVDASLDGTTWETIMDGNGKSLANWESTRETGSCCRWSWCDCEREYMHRFQPGGDPPELEKLRTVCCDSNCNSSTCGSSYPPNVDWGPNDNRWPCAEPDGCPLCYGLCTNEGTATGVKVEDSRNSRTRVLPDQAGVRAIRRLELCSLERTTQVTTDCSPPWTAAPWWANPRRIDRMYNCLAIEPKPGGPKFRLGTYQDFTFSMFFSMQLWGPRSSRDGPIFTGAAALEFQSLARMVNPSPPGDSWDLVVDVNGSLCFKFNNRYLSCPSTVSDEWYHVAVTVGRTTGVAIYLTEHPKNGTTEKVANPTWIMGSSNHLDFGGASVNAEVGCQIQYQWLKVANIAMWRRVLTQQELDVVFNAGVETNNPLEEHDNFTTANFDFPAGEHTPIKNLMWLGSHSDVHFRVPPWSGIEDKDNFGRDWLDSVSVTSVQFDTNDSFAFQRSVIPYAIFIKDLDGNADARNYFINTESFTVVDLKATKHVEVTLWSDTYPQAKLELGDEVGLYHNPSITNNNGLLILLPDLDQRVNASGKMFPVKRVEVKVDAAVMVFNAISTNRQAVMYGWVSGQAARIDDNKKDKLDYGTIGVGTQGVLAWYPFDEILYSGRSGEYVAIDPLTGGSYSDVDLFDRTPFNFNIRAPANTRFKTGQADCPYGGCLDLTLATQALSVKTDNRISPLSSVTISGWAKLKDTAGGRPFGFRGLRIYMRKGTIVVGDGPNKLEITDASIAVDKWVHLIVTLDRVRDYETSGVNKTPSSPFWNALADNPWVPTPGAVLSELRVFYRIAGEHPSPTMEDHRQERVTDFLHRPDEICIACAPDFFNGFVDEVVLHGFGFSRERAVELSWFRGQLSREYFHPLWDPLRDSHGQADTPFVSSNWDGNDPAPAATNVRKPVSSYVDPGLVSECRMDETANPNGACTLHWCNGNKDIAGPNDCGMAQHGGVFFDAYVSKETGGAVAYAHLSVKSEDFQSVRVRSRTAGPVSVYVNGARQLPDRAVKTWSSADNADYQYVRCQLWEGQKSDLVTANTSMTSAPTVGPTTSPSVSPANPPGTPTRSPILPTASPVGTPTSSPSLSPTIRLGTDTECDDKYIKKEIKLKPGWNALLFKFHAPKDMERRTGSRITLKPQKTLLWNYAPAVGKRVAIVDGITLNLTVAEPDLNAKDGFNFESERSRDDAELMSQAPFYKDKLRGLVDRANIQRRPPSPCGGLMAGKPFDPPTGPSNLLEFPDQPQPISVDLKGQGIAPLWFSYDCRTNCFGPVNTWSSRCQGAEISVKNENHAGFETLRGGGGSEIKTQPVSITLEPNQLAMIAFSYTYPYRKPNRASASPNQMGPRPTGPTDPMNGPKLIPTIDGYSKDSDRDLSVWVQTEKWDILLEVWGGWPGYARQYRGDYDGDGIQPHYRSSTNITQEDEAIEVNCSIIDPRCGNAGSGDCITWDDDVAIENPAIPTGANGRPRRATGGTVRLWRTVDGSPPGWRGYFSELFTGQTGPHVGLWFTGACQDCSLKCQVKGTPFRYGRDFEADSVNSSLEVKEHCITPQDLGMTAEEAVKHKNGGMSYKLWSQNKAGRWWPQIMNGSNATHGCEGASNLDVGGLFPGLCICAGHGTCDLSQGCICHGGAATNRKVGLSPVPNSDVTEVGHWDDTRNCYDCAEGYWGFFCSNRCPGAVLCVRGADAMCKDPDDGTGVVCTKQGNCEREGSLPCNVCHGHGICGSDGPGGIRRLATGLCSCDEGWDPVKDCSDCIRGAYGRDCLLRCPFCDTNETACAFGNTSDGGTRARPTSICNHQQCDDGMFGIGTCQCKDPNVVPSEPDSATGFVNCSGPCKEGWFRGNNWMPGNEVKWCDVYCPGSKTEAEDASCVLEQYPNDMQCRPKNDTSIGDCDRCPCEGRWGEFCEKPCDCSGHGSCSRRTGLQCNCFSDMKRGFWSGDFCSKCKTGFVGYSCTAKNLPPTRATPLERAEYRSWNRKEPYQIPVQPHAHLGGYIPVALDVDTTDGEVIFGGNPLLVAYGHHIDPSRYWVQFCDQCWCGEFHPKCSDDCNVQRGSAGLRSDEYQGTKEKPCFSCAEVNNMCSLPKGVDPSGSGMACTPLCPRINFQGSPCTARGGDCRSEGVYNSIANAANEAIFLMYTPSRKKHVSDGCTIRKIHELWRCDNWNKASNRATQTLTKDGCTEVDKDDCGVPVFDTRNLPTNQNRLQDSSCSRAVVFRNQALEDILVAAATLDRKEYPLVFLLFSSGDLFAIDVKRSYLREKAREDDGMPNSPAAKIVPELCQASQAPASPSRSPTAAPTGSGSVPSQSPSAAPSASPLMPSRCGSFGVVKGWDIEVVDPVDTMKQLLVGGSNSLGTWDVSVFNIVETGTSKDRVALERSTDTWSDTASRVCRTPGGQEPSWCSKIKAWETTALPSRVTKLASAGNGEMIAGITQSLETGGKSMGLVRAKRDSRGLWEIIGVDVVSSQPEDDPLFGKNVGELDALVVDKATKMLYFAVGDQWITRPGTAGMGATPQIGRVNLAGGVDGMTMVVEGIRDLQPMQNSNPTLESKHINIAPERLTELVVDSERSVLWGVVGNALVPLLVPFLTYGVESVHPAIVSRAGQSVITVRGYGFREVDTVGLGASEVAQGVLCGFEIVDQFVTTPASVVDGKTILCRTPYAGGTGSSCVSAKVSVSLSGSRMGQVVETIADGRFADSDVTIEFVDDPVIKSIDNDYGEVDNPVIKSLGLQAIVTNKLSHVTVYTAGIPDSGYVSCMFYFARPPDWKPEWDILPVSCAMANFTPQRCYYGSDLPHQDLQLCPAVCRLPKHCTGKVQGQVVGEIAAEIANKTNLLSPYDCCKDGSSQLFSLDAQVDVAKQTVTCDFFPQCWPPGQGRLDISLDGTRYTGRPVNLSLVEGPCDLIVHWDPEVAIPAGTKNSTHYANITEEVVVTIGDCYGNSLPLADPSDQRRIRVRRTAKNHTDVELLPNPNLEVDTINGYAIFPPGTFQLYLPKVNEGYEFSVTDVSGELRSTVLKIKISAGEPADIVITQQPSPRAQPEGRDLRRLPIVQVRDYANNTIESSLHTMELAGRVIDCIPSDTSSCSNESLWADTADALQISEVEFAAWTADGWKRVPLDNTVAVTLSTTREIEMTSPRAHAPGCGPDAAIDGNTSTSWIPLGSPVGDPGLNRLELRFQKPTLFDAYMIRPGSYGNKNSFQERMDVVSWTVEATTTPTDPAPWIMLSDCSAKAHLMRATEDFNNDLRGQVLNFKREDELNVSAKCRNPTHTKDPRNCECIPVCFADCGTQTPSNAPTLSPTHVRSPTQSPLVPQQQSPSPTAEKYAGTNWIEWFHVFTDAWDTGTQPGWRRIRITPTRLLGFDDQVTPGKRVPSRGVVGIPTGSNGDVLLERIAVEPALHGHVYKVAFSAKPGVLPDRTVHSDPILAPECHLLNASCPDPESKDPGEACLKVHGATHCITCPKHAVCNGSDVVLADRGAWRLSPTSLQFKPCASENACPRASAEWGEALCAENHYGAVCGLCEAGYVQDYFTDECQKCPAAAAFLVILGLLILTGGLACLVVLVMVSEQRNVQVYAQILINHLQTTFLLSMMSAPWPASVKRFFSFLEIFSFQFAAFEPFACLIKEHGYNVQGFFVIYLICVVAAAFPLALVAAYGTQWYRKRHARFFRGHILHEGDIAREGASPRVNWLEGRFEDHGKQNRDGWTSGVPKDYHEDEADWQRLSSRYMRALRTSVTVILFLSYISVVLQATNFLLCEEAEEVWPCEDDQNVIHPVPEGCTETGKVQRTLRGDASVDCDSSAHQAFKRVGIVILGLWMVGVPLIMTLAIQGSQHVSGDKATFHRFPFILAGLRVQCWFWPAVVMLRKSLLVMVSDAISNAELQLCLAAWTVNTALVLHVWQRPYEKRVFNFVETVSLGVLAVELNSGFFLLQEKSMSLDYFLGSVMILMNSIFLLVMIFLTARTLLCPQYKPRVSTEAITRSFKRLMAKLLKMGDVEEEKQGRRRMLDVMEVPEHGRGVQPLQQGDRQEGKKREEETAPEDDENEQRKIREQLTRDRAFASTGVKIPEPPPACWVDIAMMGEIKSESISQKKAVISGGLMSKSSVDIVDARGRGIYPFEGGLLLGAIAENGVGWEYKTALEIKLLKPRGTLIVDFGDAGTTYQWRKWLDESSKLLRPLLDLEDDGEDSAPYASFQSPRPQNATSLLQPTPVPIASPLAPPGGGSPTAHSGRPSSLLSLRPLASSGPTGGNSSQRGLLSTSTGGAGTPDLLRPSGARSSGTPLGTSPPRRRWSKEPTELL